MKTKLIIILLSIAAFSASAQSFSSLEDKKGDNPFLEDGAKFYLRYTSLKGKYTEHLGGLTVNLGLRKDKFTQGALRYRFENSALGDGIYAIAKGIKRVKDDDKLFERSEQTISSGFVGWHSLGFNAKADDRLLLTPGVSFGDVLLGTKRRTTTQSGSIVTDPAGYYFYAGPHMLATYLMNDKMWLDVYGQYDITFIKVADPKSDYTENPDYKLPSLFTLGADLYTTYKLFGGVRMVRMMDSGANKDNGTRIDLSVGLMF